MIRVIQNKIIATEDEMRTCPVNPRWASRMLELLGPQLVAESKKLRAFLTCPEVAEAAGLKLKVVKTLEEFNEEVKKAKEE